MCVVRLRFRGFRCWTCGIGLCGVGLRVLSLSVLRWRVGVGRCCRGGCLMSERVRIRRGALVVARREAGFAGVTVGEWLEEAAREYVELQQALRAQEAQDRERWGGWHPDDGLAAT